MVPLPAPWATTPVATGVPSPQSIVAVWVSALPLSVKVAGSRLIDVPSLVVWLVPAETTGAALLTVTISVSQLSAPSSSVTQTSTA